MALGPIIARIAAAARTAGKGAAAGALAGGGEERPRVDPVMGTAERVGRVPPVRPDTRGETHTPRSSPATPSSSETVEEAGESLTKALEEQGRDVAAAVGRLERALKETLSTRTGKTSGGSSPEPLAPASPSREEKGSSGWLAGAAGAMAGKGAAPGKFGRVVEGVKGRFGGVTSRIGGLAKGAAGGIVGTGAYMAGEWGIEKVTRAIGEALYGKDRVDRARALIDGPFAGIQPTEPRTRKAYDTRAIRFKADDMAFDFGAVTGLTGVGGEGGSTLSEGVEDEGYGDGPTDGGPPGGTGGDREPVGPAGPGMKELTDPGGRPLSGPTSKGETVFDPTGKGMTYTPPRVGGAPLIKSDEEVKEFWADKGRNPQGAKLFDDHGDPLVDPQLLAASASGIKAFEARNPQYKVQAYGPASGLRTSGSTSNHGHQEGGHGGAVDFAIIDRKTGKKLTNHPGANHQGQGTVGETAPIYQEFFNDTVGAGEALYPGFKKKARSGLYFGSGANAMDSMHIDMRGQKVGMAGGSVDGGFTPEQMRRWGITRNIPYKDDPNRFGQPAPVNTVKTTPWEPNAVQPHSFDRSFPVQPQGEFVGSAAPLSRPEPAADIGPRKTVVRRGGQSPDERDEARTTKRHRFDPDERQAERSARFEEYMGVGGNEVTSE